MKQLQYMKKYISKIAKHPLISGSAVIVIGGFLANFFNFLFNLFMSRNLSIADYGTFASLVSIITLTFVVAGAGIPTVVNFAASYFATDDTERLKALYIICTEYYLFGGSILFFIFLFFPGQIGQFFNVHNNTLIILVGFTLFAIFVSMVNASFLQAKLSFMYISFMNLLGAAVKYFFGIMFIVLGLGIFGGLLAYLSAFIVGYILSFFPLLRILRHKMKTQQFSRKSLLLYGAPSAIAMFGLTSFVSADIILVKHFFSPGAAGLYAGLSLVGRVIFFLTAPVGSVMFSLISQKHAKMEKYHNEFLLSLAMVFIPSICITLFYFFFPDFTISFFIRKKEYLQMRNLLGLFALYITCYSLLTVFTNFYLSIKKTKIVFPIVVGLILQIILLWVFHKTFLEVIIISFSVVSILLVLFILYYIKENISLLKTYASYVKKKY